MTRDEIITAAQRRFGPAADIYTLAISGMTRMTCSDFQEFDGHTFRHIAVSNDGQFAINSRNRNIFYRGDQLAEDAFQAADDRMGG